MEFISRIKLDLSNDNAQHEEVKNQKKQKKKCMEMSPWSKDTWKTKAIQQNPFNLEDSDAVIKKLSLLPPIVLPEEIDILSKALEDVYYGQKFILQGGDCAELFNECTCNLLDVKLKILTEMSLVISQHAKLSVIKIGRIAGQYAKPRSAEEEFVNGKMICTYRGDSVNGISPLDRKPNPKRLLSAYFHSTATLNYLRSKLSCQLNDFDNAQIWDSDVISNAQHAGIQGTADNTLLDAEINSNKSLNFFTSHEALILPYESALTRKYKSKWYDTSSHFLWIGDRTRQLHCAHVEFCRGIANPVGIKLGPSSIPCEIIQISRLLNPLNIPGKVILITRFGVKEVEEKLPVMIKAVKESGIKVIWQCDPMHGNTETTLSNIKTRKFENILNEIVASFKIHKMCGSRLGGLHFEMTGENVTECIGGPQGIKETDLLLSYTTHCDPRLNYDQSMNIAIEVAKQLKLHQKS